MGQVEKNLQPCLDKIDAKLTQSSDLEKEIEPFPLKQGDQGEDVLLAATKTNLEATNDNVMSAAFTVISNFHDKMLSGAYHQRDIWSNPSYTEGAVSYTHLTLPTIYSV